MAKFFGVEGTKTIAQRYANELLVAHKRYPGSRLQEAVNNVLAFATNGIWKDITDRGYLD